MFHTPAPRHLRRLLHGLVPVAASLLAAPIAHAQVPLAFSGGGGSPLTITLVSPVTYTITTANPAGSVPYFSFIGAAGTDPFFSLNSASTLTYRINDSAARPITFVRNDYTAGSLGASDLLIGDPSSAGPALAVGDLVTLSAGTITTNAPVNANAPADNTFTTFIANGSGNRLSANGAAAAPEPGTIALLLTAGVPVVGMVRRRTKSRA